VKLRELRVTGFGRLADRTVVFEPRVNVVYGPNEAGKSTLTAALLASLYGLGRGEKELWRPWSGARFATSLVYELADGRTYEVQREYDRDTRGVQIFDRNGNDASGDCTVGKSISPGQAHLGMPLEVFVNAAFVGQGDVRIDGTRAGGITQALSRALDGGPKEYAALDAIKHLDDALATHVGKKKATVNAPLKHLYDEIAEAQERSETMRGQLHELEDLRGRLKLETQRLAELETAVRESERRGRALRVFTLRSRLEALREIRADLAALHAKRGQYDDVENFPAHEVARLDELYRAWQNLDTVAHAHEEEAVARRFTPALAAEFAERETDGGALDDAAYADLGRASAAVRAAREATNLATARAQSARSAIDGGNELFGAAAAAAILLLVGALATAAIHVWIGAAVLTVLAVVVAVVAWSAGRRRRAARATVTKMQRAADTAAGAERDAAARVAAILAPLRVGTLEELASRRERARELRERRDEARRLAERCEASYANAERAGATFDALASRLITKTASRAGDLAAARTREARTNARAGIDTQLRMFGVRRSDVLGTDDEAALEAELLELRRAGVEAAALEGASPRAFEAERADLERRASESRALVAATAAELRTSEAQIGDLAALDEQVTALRLGAERLERFEAAVTHARRTIDERTREAHQRFASRLADYASRTFAGVTADRYVDLRVDPATLALRARAPETGAFVSVEQLSAGTREQAYLVVRLAMARMFGEGLETAPLLLDDPFAYWDDARIERGLPVIEAASLDAQIVLFTTSRQLADGAARRGARLIELGPQADVVAALIVDALDRNENLPLLPEA